MTNWGICVIPKKRSVDVEIGAKNGVSICEGSPTKYEGWKKFCWGKKLVLWAPYPFILADETLRNLYDS